MNVTGKLLSIGKCPSWEGMQSVIIQMDTIVINIIKTIH